jgi:membrane-bound serine protease (ClpP class)
MIERWHLLWIIFSFVGTAVSSSPAALASEPKPFTVLVASYEGAITPPAVEWMISAIHTAQKEQDQIVVIQLDTPGGLLESTRLLVKEIEASSVPVVVYISPAGARAASAGTFITLAAHVSAMSPGTRIGAAHPVELGKETKGDLRAKMENDTVAFIKTIATSRNKNIQWAEDAVRKSSSATEREALSLNVIDLIAKDLPRLLESLHERKVKTAGGTKTIKTKGASLKAFPMSLRIKFLRTLTDPNIAYILMMIGIYGILYEIINPGAVLPGVAGSICLIVGLYSMQTLPINYAGVALLVLAVILFIIESQATSGLLGLGGIIALGLGSLLLVPAEFPYMQISRTLIAGMVLLSAVLMLALISVLVKIRRRKPVSGAESMIGQTAVAKTDLEPSKTGQVSFGGEIWNAESTEKILKGEPVEVIAVEKLKLIVKRK